MTARCEPPEGWRERDGDHWLNAIDQELVAEWSAEFQMWHCGSRFGWQRLEQMAGFTYLSPVAPPAVVRGLVEALEGLLVGCEYRPGGYSFAFGDDVPAGWGTKTIPTDAALDAARSALAAAKEAGP